MARYARVHFGSLLLLQLILLTGMPQNLPAVDGAGDQDFAPSPPNANGDPNRSGDSNRSPSGSLLLSEGIAPNVPFEGWDPREERFIFLQSGRQFAFEPTQFLRWGSLAEFSVTDACLVLSDGSILSGLPLCTRTADLNSQNAQVPHSAPFPSLTSAKEQEVLEWENPFFGTLTFSLNELGGIVFPGLPNSQREPLLPELLHSPRGRDVLVFRTGERLEGEILSISEESVRFQTRDLSLPPTETFLPASQVLEISQFQLAALLFSTELRIRTPFSSAEKYFWIGLSDGSLLRMSPQSSRFPLASVTRGAVFYLESPQESQKFFDSSLTSAAAELSELHWLDEIPPSEVRLQDPFGNEASISQTVFWNAQAAADGQRLRSGGKVCRRGFGVRGNTVLIWKLDPNFSIFGTIPTLSSSFPGVSVRFRIYTDKKLAAERTLNSDSKPELLRVPISGASELRLETEILTPPDSSLAPTLDAAWLDAFLVPSEN